MIEEHVTTTARTVHTWLDSTSPAVSATTTSAKEKSA